MASQMRGKGQVMRRRTKHGVTWAIRFRAYGSRHYVTLGSSKEGWTRQRAEEELANVLADVRRGTWRPPEPEPQPSEPEPEPTFHEFASDWFSRRKLGGLQPRSLEYYEWALSNHLLPHLASMHLSEITIAEVDRYTRVKASEARLSNGSINKTLEVLASVLELAVEYGLLSQNPAKGRRRRLPVQRTTGAHLEPAQVAALVDAAGELDDEDRTGRRYRRPLLATLAFAGLRVGELLALRWADVDLAQGRIKVKEAKTPAGVREVDIQPELRDELVLWKATTTFRGPTNLVFPTGKGKPENRNNVRRRVLLRATARANERARGESEQIHASLSPHALRRTYASWLVGEGEDIAYVMGQLGHTDPKMTLGLYAKALRSKRRRADLDPAEEQTFPPSSPPAPAVRRLGSTTP
jgi:integrase